MSEFLDGIHSIATAGSYGVAGENTRRSMAVGVVMMIALHVGCASDRLAAPGPTLGSGDVSCAQPNVGGDPNVSSPPKCLHFSNLEWVLKSSARFDPGPNAWSDDPANVWVDSQGLHLKITNRGGHWYAAEAILNAFLSYGTYAFDIRSDPAQLDPNVVLGLFTYNYLDPALAHREVDIEFSPRLGISPGEGGHFTVQPYQRPGNSGDFHITTPWSGRHQFAWHQDRILFQSLAESWVYNTNVPDPTGAQVRINLWLLNGQPPINGRDSEIVIDHFSYQPG